MPIVALVRETLENRAAHLTANPAMRADHGVGLDRGMVGDTSFFEHGTRSVKDRMNAQVNVWADENRTFTSIKDDPRINDRSVADLDRVVPQYRRAPSARIDEQPNPRRHQFQIRCNSTARSREDIPGGPRQGQVGRI